MTTWEWLGAGIVAIAYILIGFVRRWRQRSEIERMRRAISAVMGGGYVVAKFSNDGGKTWESLS